MGRSILILLLILVIVVSLDPRVHEKITNTWEEVRPAVVASMDGMYAVIRSFIAGDEADNRTNDSPLLPGVRFDEIIT
jgi:hypothetical protein